jgi:hypothetical protein
MLDKSDEILKELKILNEQVAALNKALFWPQIAPWVGVGLIAAWIVQHLLK